MATTSSKNLVKTIVSSSKELLTSRQIFERAVALHPASRIDNSKAPGTNSQFNRTRAKNTFNAVNRNVASSQYISSLTQLKRIILPDLEGRNIIQKVHVKREPTSTELEERIRAASKKAAKKGRTVDLERITQDQSELVDGWVWKFNPEAEATVPAPIIEVEPQVRRGQAPGEGLMPHQPPNIHLNTRRRNARPAKVAAERAWVKELERQVQAGMKQVEKDARKLGKRDQLEAASGGHLAT